MNYSKRTRRDSWLLLLTLLAAGFAPAGIGQTLEIVDEQRYDNALLSVGAETQRASAAAPGPGVASGVVKRRLGDSVLEEFRLSGRTHTVRVLPENGVPYYVLDVDGDGEVQPGDDGTSATGWRVFKW